MSTGPVSEDWITVEEATDEHLAKAVAERLGARGVAMRLAPAGPSDPSREPSDLTVQVPLDRFEEALRVLEELDEEDL